MGLENGVYVVTDAGSAGSPWRLTRAEDADSGDELEGALVYVLEGASEANKLYACQGGDDLVVGVSDLPFGVEATFP